MQLTKEELETVTAALTELRVAAMTNAIRNRHTGAAGNAAFWEARAKRADEVRDRVKQESDIDQLVELLGPMGWERGKMTVTHVQDIDKGGRYVRVEQPDKGVRYVVVGRENPPYPVTVASSRPDPQFKIGQTFKDHKGQVWVVSETNPLTTTKIGEEAHRAEPAGEDLKTAVVEAIREGFTYVRGSSDTERSRTPVLREDDWDRILVALEQRQRDVRDNGSRTVAARYQESINRIREARNGR